MNNDFRTRMAQYEQELLRLQQQRPQAPEPPPAPTPPAPSFVHILVTDQATALPVPSAIVTVEQQTEHGRMPLYVRFSDRYGRIEPLPLPSDHTGGYTITAAAPGYLRQTVSKTFSSEEEHLHLQLQPLSVNREGSR